MLVPIARVRNGDAQEETLHYLTNSIDNFNEHFQNIEYVNLTQVGNLRSASCAKNGIIV